MLGPQQHLAGPAPSNPAAGAGVRGTRPWSASEPAATAAPSSLLRGRERLPPWAVGSMRTRSCGGGSAYRRSHGPVTLTGTSPRAPLSPRTCVQANVHLEAPRGGEALHAVLALEGLDARVRLDVGGQRALHGEGPEALGALEGLLMGVDADMAHQVAGLAELLGAVGAHMPAHAVLLTDRPWGGRQTGPAWLRTVLSQAQTSCWGSGDTQTIRHTSVCFLPRQRVCAVNCGEGRNLHNN